MNVLSVIDSFLLLRCDSSHMYTYLCISHDDFAVSVCFSANIRLRKALGANY